MNRGSLITCFNRFWRCLGRIVERDLFNPFGRLAEFMSLISMCGWLYVLLAREGLFNSPGYVGFHGVSQQTWITVFGTAVCLQCIAILWRPKRYWGELRFVSMVFASSIWLIVTVNFTVADAPTTATATYFGMFFVCTILGFRLAWKASSPRS